MHMINYTTCKVQIVSGTISLHFVSLLRLLEKKIPTVLSFLSRATPNVRPSVPKTDALIH